MGADFGGKRYIFQKKKKQKQIQTSSSKGVSEMSDTPHGLLNRKIRHHAQWGGGGVETISGALFWQPQGCREMIQLLRF